jgi:hypothetical protein
MRALILMLAHVCPISNRAHMGTHDKEVKPAGRSNRSWSSVKIEEVGSGIRDGSVQPLFFSGVTTLEHG